jgi:hypothetical protein
MSLKLRCRKPAETTSTRCPWLRVSLVYYTHVDSLATINGEMDARFTLTDPNATISVVKCQRANACAINARSYTLLPLSP